MTHQKALDCLNRAYRAYIRDTRNIPVRLRVSPALFMAYEAGLALNQRFIPVNDPYLSAQVGPAYRELAFRTMRVVLDSRVPLHHVYVKGPS